MKKPIRNGTTTAASLSLAGLAAAGLMFGKLWEHIYKFSTTRPTFDQSKIFVPIFVRICLHSTK